MYPGIDSSIETTLLSLLERGPKRTTDLVAAVMRLTGKTRQAAYLALRKLKEREIVVVSKSIASLNVTWLNKMTEFLTVARHQYLHESINDNGFLNLHDGEKVQYNFNSPAHTDAFWSHVFNILVETSQTNDPVFIYDPHDWFLITRLKNERLLMESVTARGKLLLVAVQGKTPLDAYVSRHLDDPLQQYSKGILISEDKSYYLNIIDDYLIEVWLDKEGSKQIEEVYNKTAKYDEKAITQLERITASKGKNKFRVSRNARKALKLKKQLSKYFSVPKS